MKNRSALSSLLPVMLVLLALCGGPSCSRLPFGAALFVGASGDADAGEVRVEVTKPGSGPFLVKGGTYATFLTLYYVNEKGEKTFSGFST